LVGSDRTALHADRRKTSYTTVVAAFEDRYFEPGALLSRFIDNEDIA
jgi:hypothetical protein